MNKFEAQKLVQKWVIANKCDCALMTEATEEYDFGWAFYYQLKKYIETKDYREMLVGHGPILVDRNSAQMFETGSAYSTEHYVKAYTATGDPFAEPTSHIQIAGSRDGADKLAAIGYKGRIAWILLASWLAFSLA